VSLIRNSISQTFLSLPPPRRIIEWTKEKADRIKLSPVLDHYKSVDMAGVRFDQLQLRLGFPYVYHHGGCDHLIMFRDMVNFPEWSNRACNRFQIPFSLIANLQPTVSYVPLQKDWPKCTSPTPSSLYKLCALLLHEGLVRLSDLYPHVSTMRTMTGIRAIVCWTNLVFELT